MVVATRTLVEGKQKNEHTNYNNVDTGVANFRPTVLLILDGKSVLKRVTERRFTVLRI